MYYFPKAKVTFVSRLTDDQIISRLALNIEPEKMRYEHWTLIPEKHKIFEGTLFNSRLRIKRISSHSSLCNPVITGTIKANPPDQTIVRLEFRLTGIHATLLFLWMVIATMAGLAGFSMLFSHTENLGMVLGMIGAWFGSYFLIIWRFSVLVDRSIRDFSKITEAAPDTYMR